MIKVYFDYKGNIFDIPSKKDEKMEVIFQKFISMAKLNKESIYFIYSGKSNINKELTFDDIANIDDKKINQMNILVNEINKDNLSSSIIKSKEVICPKCNEFSKIHLDDYQISIKCKNGHLFENLTFVEYQKTQNYDISKIFCGICKMINKSNTFNNIFYRCISCKINLCPICRTKHDNSHNIINYDQKGFICENHNDNYNSYCKNCKINLCKFCEKNHNSHEIISYGKLVQDINDIKKKNDELKKKVIKFKNDIIKIINLLNEVIENIEQYYKIINYITNNYHYKRINYEILHNLKKIYYYDDIKKYLINIIEDTNVQNKFRNLLDIHDKITNKEKNIINIIYKVEDKHKDVKIFSDEFVKNNKSLCKIMNEGIEYELKEKFNLNDCKKVKNILKIKLKGIRNITSAWQMFRECSSLLSLPDISEWNTIKVTNMRAMFSSCSSLSSLSNISKWDTSNATTMKNMFYE